MYDMIALPTPRKNNSVLKFPICFNTKYTGKEVRLMIIKF